AGARDDARVALERMAAHVQAERFLLEVERLGFRPRPRRGEQRRVVGRRRPDVVAAEELRLALIAIALMAAAVIEDAIEAGEQARAPGEVVGPAARRERVHRAGF